jgi:uncharacterized protein YycO
MQKVQILFYEGRSLLNWAIRFQTRSRYSHVAFLFNGDTLIEAAPFKGVHERHKEKIDEAADVYSVYMTDAQYTELLSWCRDRVGCKYDWPAVIRFVSRRHSHEDCRFFCSEFIAEGLYAVGIQVLRARPWTISPGLLACSMRLVRE